MLIAEILSESEDIDESLVWGRTGTKLKKKFRCTSGLRKGRVVSSPEQCSLPLDIGKSVSLKKTKKKYGRRLVKKAKKTKRINPASRKLVIINRRKK